MVVVWVFVVVVVVLCLLYVVVGYEKEIKFNNYLNFEFYELLVQEIVEVELYNFESFEFLQLGDKVLVVFCVQKVNNYFDFKFLEMLGYGQVCDGNVYD